MRSAIRTTIYRSRRLFKSHASQTCLAFSNLANNVSFALISRGRNSISYHSYAMGSASSCCKRCPPVTPPRIPRLFRGTRVQPVRSESSMSEGEEYVEAVVANTKDVGNGQMKEVPLGEEGKVLLINDDGKLSAVAHKCTHYGAPLEKGCLSKGRVRCPWHGACFNATTGDIEDFPGLDSLPCYDLRVEGKKIIVRAKKKDLISGKRQPTFGGSTEGDSRVFLIVGGGPASVECAETLRQEGFGGRVIICTKENNLPYDRPKLSKALNLTAEAIALRPESFYQERKIEIQLGKEVTAVDPSGKKVTFASGETQCFDKLLLATGGKPRILPIPGHNLQNVFVLRQPAQANAIARISEGRRVVVIGTSFIGMEVASYLSDKATVVECVDIAAVPFERVLGSRIGLALQQMLEEKGVKFHLGVGIKELLGDDNDSLTDVILSSGKKLCADVCVFGVGVSPATDFLKSSGLEMSKYGEVIVDEYMKVTEDIYAAGDIAKFPLPLIGSSISIGHWQLAHYHGRIAGQNMMGKGVQFNSIPYFWTVLCGKSLRYCGFASSWDEIIYDGDPKDLKFAAFFIKDDKVLAAASLMRDPVVSQTAELMYQGRMPSGTQLKNNMDISSYL